MQKNATVNKNLGFDDVCSEKHVIVAYNNDYNFKVSNITGELVKEEKFPFQIKLNYGNVAWEWEVQEAFFEFYNIKPRWINANYSWGWLDNVTNTWTGAVGMIERDEADYALWGFSGTYERSKVAAFSPGIDYAPKHWLTRYPLELPPTWNLVRLFTKGYISRISFLLK